MSFALKRSALHELGVRNFQGSFTQNLLVSSVRWYFSSVKRMKVVTCIILVWVPFEWWTPILSCVLEQFCKLHFWQRYIRDGGEALNATVSAREAKTSSSAHTEKQIPLTEAGASLPVQGTQGVCNMMLTESPSSAWCAKRISERTPCHNCLLLFVLLPHIQLSPSSSPSMFFCKRLIQDDWGAVYLVKGVRLGSLHSWKLMKITFTVISHCYRKSPDD